MFFKNWVVELLKPVGRLVYEFEHRTQARFLPDGVNRKSRVRRSPFNTIDRSNGVQKAKTMNMKNAKTERALKEVQALLKHARRAEAKRHYASAFEMLSLARSLDPKRQSLIFRTARNFLHLRRVSDAEAIFRKIHTIPNLKNG